MNKLLVGLMASIISFGTIAGDEIRIAGSRNGAWALLSLLPEACEKRGLTINYVDVDPKITVSGLLISLDRNEFDMVGVSTTSALTALSNGANIRLVANTSVGGVSLAVQPGINSVKDLKGKRVGTFKGSGSELAFMMSMEKQGIKYDGDNPDVTLVPIILTAMTQVFLQKEVDAVVQPFPEVKETILRGGGKVLETYDTQYRPLLAHPRITKSAMDKFYACYSDVTKQLKDKKFANEFISKVHKSQLSVDDPLSIKYDPNVSDAELKALADFMIAKKRIKEGFVIPPEFNTSNNIK